MPNHGQVDAGDSLHSNEPPAVETHINTWLQEPQGFAQLRRMLGLFAFFYGTLHFLTYLLLDQGLALDDILQDISKRPFITA